MTQALTLGSKTVKSVRHTLYESKFDSKVRIILCGYRIDTRKQTFTQVVGTTLCATWFDFGSSVV